MLIINLKRQAIIKSDFSTFGYKFSIDSESEFIQNDAAVILNSLMDADLKKITHGFHTFIDVDVDVDFMYNDFFPKVQKDFNLVFNLDYNKLTNSYVLSFIEDVFEKIKQSSIMISLNNFDPNISEVSEKIINYTSFIIIPINVNSKDYEKFLKRDITLIYKDINSEEDVRKALKDELVPYYSGFYIEEPKKLPVKTTRKPPSMVTELFVKLRTPEDIQTAIEIIKRSPELTFSILRFINSAVFMIPSRVSSVESAVTLLGFHNLKKWVNLLFLSSSVPNPAENIYVEKAVSRAYFMEKICKLIEPSKIGSAYMVGLFSFMDSLTGMSFEEIFKDIPISEEVSDALIKENNFYAELLNLARAVEFKDEEKQEHYIQLTKDKIMRAHLESLYEYDRFIDAVK